MISFRLFDDEPATKTLFGLTEDTVVSKELENSPDFVRHAKHFIKMVNQALELLGPDMELLTDILLALGQKHVLYGVQPEVSVPTDGDAIKCNAKT